MSILRKTICTLIVVSSSLGVTYAQTIRSETQETLAAMRRLQLNNQTDKALLLLDSALTQKENSPDDLAYLYAHKSGLLISSDSLMPAKIARDNSAINAAKAGSNGAKAIARLASASMNRALDMNDEAVEEAIEGLKLLENSQTDPNTQYSLCYLLYGIYSQWKNEEKMEKYIRQSEKYAVLSKNYNLQVNASNGISSMFLAKYQKTQDKQFVDSSFVNLQKSFSIRQTHPDEVSANTFAITCINIANYYLQYSTQGLLERRKQAFKYLYSAEQELVYLENSSRLWVNIFGIKSSFALLENDFSSAEAFLIEGLNRIEREPKPQLRSQYTVYENLAGLASRKNNFRSAWNYQKKAEELLKELFNQQQIFNAQKLEVLYETEKKDQELKLLGERAEARRKQNYLYAGIAIISLIGLLFMFRAYHFKLRYSLERAQKIAHEKEEAERTAAMQVQLEKEEQARLQAEQELLRMRQLQLEKEALTTALLLSHKNETLAQIRSEIKDGDTKSIQKLLKEEMLLSADFDDVKWQIQQLHPNFFGQLAEKAVQKLTPLDLKYCAYIHLQMTTRQIAQLLHVEEQSVRMFKYRLKQKFNLPKDVSLENFLRSEG